MTTDSQLIDQTGSRRRRSRAVFIGAGVILIGAATLVLRASPVFDPSVQELWGRLTKIRVELAAAESDRSQWQSFTERATVQLRGIADDARRAHQRQGGIWSRVASDRREVAALKEVERIAQSDLPALIASGPAGNPLRSRSVGEALARLDDHVGGASPYLPPIRPMENQEGLERAPAGGNGWRAWLLRFAVVDGVIVVVALLWWRRRMIHKRSEA